MNKKKKNVFPKIIGLLFIVFMAMFIASSSGYYESKIREEVVVTEDGIKEFEEAIKSGKEVDLTNFLKNEREDYSSKMSNLGDNLTTGIETVVSSGMDIFTDIIKSLF